MADLRSIVADTLHARNKALYDQVIGESAYFYYLTRKGRIQAVEGGLGIVENIQIAENDTVGWRSAKSAIPLTEQNPLAKVLWGWRNVNGAVVIFADDERKNRGKYQVRNYAQDVEDNLIDTMSKFLYSGIYSRGSDGVTLQGLSTVVSATTSYGQIGEADESWTSMNRSTGYAYWRSQVLSTTEALVISGGTDGGMRALYRNCRRGGLAATADAKFNKPVDLILSTPDLLDAYNDLLTPQQRFMDAKSAEAGFRNLMFEGAVCMDDPYCNYVTDAGASVAPMYMLNSRYLKLRPDSTCADRFIIDPRHALEEFRADRIIVEWTGNMTCTMPRVQGVLLNKS